jgi:hypothetical protein
MRLCLFAAAAFLAGLATAPGLASAQDNAAQNTPKRAKKHTSAKHDIGSGAGDVGKGAGKGVASAAKGTGKGAVDLVTLHPIDAATDLGKGAAGAGKNIGVGTVKGTGKMIKGAGKAIRHIF